MLVDYRSHFFKGAVAAHVRELAGIQEKTCCFATCWRYPRMTEFLQTLRATYVIAMRARTERILRQWRQKCLLTRATLRKLVWQSWMMKG